MVLPTEGSQEAATFLREGLKTTESNRKSQWLWWLDHISTTKVHRFKAVFGTDPLICAILWEMTLQRGPLPRGAKRCHLLWALLFLHGCDTESRNASFVGCDEKTFRKWQWILVERVAELKDEVIRWEDRFKGWNGVNLALVTIDGDTLSMSLSLHWPNHPTCFHFHCH